MTPSRCSTADRWHHRRSASPCPEGLTLPEITAKIVEQIPAFSADRLAELLGSGQIRSAYMPAETGFLEGFVYPETYQIGEGEDEASVLTKMVAQFDAVASAAGMDAAVDTVGLTPYEVVILASLVQEEAKIPGDAPKIARVIYNRLEVGEPLGIDATFCYIEVENPCVLTQTDLDNGRAVQLAQAAGPAADADRRAGTGGHRRGAAPCRGRLVLSTCSTSTTPEPGDHFFTADEDEWAEKAAACREAGQC